MIIGINEWKTLTKHLSYECECRFDGKNVIQINGGIMIKCRCECKNCHVCEKYSVSNLATCNCENGNI